MNEKRLPSFKAHGVMFFRGAGDTWTARKDGVEYLVHERADGWTGVAWRSGKAITTLSPGYSTPEVTMTDLADPRTGRNPEPVVNNPAAVVERRRYDAKTANFREAYGSNGGRR